MEPIRRVARCSCGALAVETLGEPVVSGMCSCSECQRRTGAPFGVSYYWEEGDCAISGPSTAWSRVSQRGRRFTQHFCPTCGATVWWRGEFLPGRIGVAGGAFADPALPAPQVAVWDGMRHAWLAGIADLPTHPEQRY
ncbi:GFA family protein [Rubrimonas cliftonensis]|uniref:Uncharacterized conserved protein n=1 Tax=Rubrimonas cliftonensis TaxID=89524 RepID=A0A1H4A8M9_9RHOB|nr:GFA family protein [Rubrimonas cliftonensis]SEA32260.1 Uncharacterized conserved protein [Rubrimonas cliftonensis]